MDEALRHDEGLAAATASTDLAVATTVTAGDDTGGTSYVIVLDHGANRVRSLDGTVEPHVRFTSDLTTAAAIASGTESAQAAFMAGRLRISGDSRLLMANQSVLDGLGDVFGEVRSRTDFGAAAAG